MQKAISPFSPLSSGVVLASLSLLSFLAPGCGGDGGDDGEAQQRVVLFTSESELTGATGAAGFSPGAMLDRSEGTVLMEDTVSSSVVKVASNGTPSVFASKAAMTAVTGGATVDIGPMEEVLEGDLDGVVLSADSVTGNLIRFSLLGTPSLFTTKDKVKLVAGQLTVKMALPRELTVNQFVSQNLETRDLIRFDTLGNAYDFIKAADLATEAGVVAPQAIITGWARGPVSTALFARFDSTNNIVQIFSNGSRKRYADGSKLPTLFPDVAAPRVLDMIAGSGTGTDNLLILIGDGARGVALALATDNGSTLKVYTNRATLLAIAGPTVDISDLVLLRTGAATLVDRGGSQVLALSTSGWFILGSRTDIEAVTGTANPKISVGSGIGNQGCLVPDDESDTLFLVR